MKRIVIYGVGNNCDLFMRFAHNTDFEVLAFVDQGKAGIEYHDKTVQKPEYLTELCFDELFLTVGSGREKILRKLKDEYHIRESKIRDIDYLNAHYMISGIENYKYIFFTDRIDYLNISYKELESRNDTTMRSILTGEESWQIDSYDYEHKCIFIFRSHCFEQHKIGGFFDYIAEKYKKGEKIFLLSDMCCGEFGYICRYPNFSLEFIKEAFDFVITYSRSESAQLGFLHYELPYSKTYQEKAEEDFDLFFVGNAKNRIDKIYDLYERAKDHGVSCRFWISDVQQTDIRKNSGDIIYNKRLTYEEYLKEMMHCRCIVDICQEGDETTLRYSEAVVYNKKLLTTDTSCYKKSCFDANNIKWFSNADDIDFDWLKSRAPIKYEYKDEFSPVRFLTYLDQLINEKDR